MSFWFYIGITIAVLIILLYAEHRAKQSVTNGFGFIGLICYGFFAGQAAGDPLLSFWPLAFWFITGIYLTAAIILFSKASKECSGGS